jgi:phosphonoacetaldehyde hydrolase
MTRLRGAILDWTGTLVDFGSSAQVSTFVALFGAHGVAITAEEARAPMGQGKRDHVRAIARMDAVSARWVERHGRMCTEDDVDRLYADFVPLQLAAIARRSTPIPGAREAVTAWRARGLALGSTTAYDRELAAVLVERARAAGLAIDVVVCASDVSAARPAPWMALEAARRMDVYPMRALVKIGDTEADVAEGLNAGMWTVAVCATGNEMGLDEAELAALPDAERQRRLAAIRARFFAHGAHYVVDSVADVLPLFDEIDSRLEQGERP